MKKKKIKNIVKTIGWAYRLAWKIDKKILLLWYTLSIILSILPAISLKINQVIIQNISVFIATGAGRVETLFPYIGATGAVLVAVGLSSRINKELIYLMMYDSYYIGMQELLIQHAQNIDIETLQSRESINQYISTALRAASLTDFMSSSCALLGKLINVITLLIVAVQYSYFVFVISLLYVVLIIWLNPGYIEKIRKDDKKVRELNNRANYYEKLPRNVSAAKEIRIYKSREPILKQWRTAYDEVINYEKKYIVSTERRSFISGLCFYFFVIVVISCTVFETAHRVISPSSVLTLFTLCTDLYLALTGMSLIMISAYDGLFYLEMQKKMFTSTSKQTPQISISCNSSTPIVFKASNIYFNYSNQVEAIKNVSFEIKKGEIVALVGENGCGKTTLVKLLLGIFAPQKGELYFMGQPYGHRNYEKIAQHVGVYFQDSIILHKTLRDNVGYGDISVINNDNKIIEAITKGGAFFVEKKLPNGLDTILGRQVDKMGVELSGGEKQRIGVSRAHMNNKEIMIMDEPGAALDPLGELEQYLNIKKLLQGRTAILISHRIGFARMADKIIVMKGGQIVDIGSHNSLIKKGGLYTSMFNAQANWYYQDLEEDNE